MESYPWWTEEQKKFSEEMSRFVKEIMPREAQTRWTREFPWDIFEKIGERGYTGAAIPKEYGGLGLGATGACIAMEEMGRMPGPGRAFGGNMLGGLRQIIEFGTEEQKKQHLPAIAKAEVLWCQGFSEPDAGSDLASLKTRAVEEGDDYVLNGQKIWTSYADHADWCLIGVRTDPDAPKHRGITYLLMDMKTPGITVRPIPSMFGRHFCEVFLDNVRVPRSNTLGEKNRGWYVMMQSLNYERGGYIKYARCQRTLDELVKYAKETRVRDRLLIDDPLTRHKLADMAIGIRMVRALTHHMYWMQSKHLPPGYHPSAIKIASSEFDQQFVNSAMQILGSFGRLSKDSRYVRLKGRVLREYIWAREGTVAGGTSEIQRNVIATSLGLPRER